ncbi:MAG: SMC family ATPase [Candidatus Subteraquimicrobiales bacterium]|nr:SMC family ATPase [Candidatus Subteraquimicrobiales bacterium]
MRLVSLQLKNYRKYEDELIEFPDGLIGIVGPNGVGKSTLIEAIAWVLYGNPAARTTKEQIKRQGASSKDICQVILEFEIANNHYQIIREMRGADLASDAAVYINKQSAVRGIQPTLDYTTRLIGLNKEAFFTSFFAKQKELNALADLQPAERKSLIVRMLRINDVDKTIDFLKQDIKSIDDHLNFIKSSFLQKVDINELETTLKLKTDEKEESGKKLKRGKKEEEALKIRYKILKSDFDEETRKKDERAQLLQEYKQKQGELKIIDQNLKDYRKDEKNLHALAQSLKTEESIITLYEQAKKDVEIWTKAKELNNQLKIAEKNIEETKGQLEKLKSIPSLLENTEKEMKMLENSSETLKNTLDQKRKERHSSEVKVAPLKENIEKLTKQKEEINRLGKESPCPTCFRPLGKDFETIREHFTVETTKNEVRIDKLKKEIEALKRRESNLSEEILKTQEKIKNLTEKKETIIRQRQEITYLEQTIEENKAQKRMNENKLKEIGVVVYEEKEHQKKLENLEKLITKRDNFLKTKASLEQLPKTKRKIAATKKRGEELLREMEQIKQTGQALSFSQEKYRELQKAYELAWEESKQKQKIVLNFTYELKIISRDIEEIQKSIREFKDKKKEVEELTEKRQTLDTLQIYLADFKKTLIGRIRPTLSEKASEFLRELTEEKFITMELDENYEIFIYDNGEKFSVERFSGGEKDLSSLCLRLAISQLMSESATAAFASSGGISEPGFIVLDEIFGSQDLSRKSNILKALARLNNQFRQIFLITHIEDIKDSVEYAICVQENERGVSRLSLK